MTIGIDASRANVAERTGTEWYSFHVIQELKHLIPDTHRVVLYTKEPLLPDLQALPANWESRVLNWPPGLLWTQARLSWEMLWHKPDLLYIPAHTIPLIHPKQIALVVHDVGFARQDELYNHAQIGSGTRLKKSLVNALVRAATLGRYGSSERDYHQFSMDMALKHATRIMTVSEFSKQEICDVYGLEQDRIDVIPNGLNELHTADPDTVLAHQGVNGPYICFVGRIEQKKNVPRLIEAFSILKREYAYPGQLVLVGSPGYQYEEVAKRIRHYGLERDIVETGWADGRTLGTLVRHAQLFVLPSLYEGFGIPILEAMRLETPVACSAIPALQEVGSDAAAYFDPAHPASIAECCHAVLTDNNMRDRLIQNGVERARAFSWERTARESWRVIQRCLTTTP